LLLLIPRVGARMIFKFAGGISLTVCSNLGRLCASSGVPAGRLKLCYGRRGLVPWSDHSIIPTLQNAAAICKTQRCVTFGDVVSMVMMRF